MITEEQRIARRSSIGGSDMPIIMGLSPYKTPYQLYLEKKGLVEPDNTESQSQYWGNQLEPLVRSEFQKRNSVEINSLETQEHPLFPFLRGNLDGWIPAWGSVWEAKTASSFRGQDWGESGSDMIPLPYRVQVAFYCSLMNCQNAYISVLIGGNDYREFRYDREIELETKIIDAAVDFWEALENDQPVPPVNTDDMRLKWGNSESGKLKTVSNELDYILGELYISNGHIKSHQKIVEDRKFEIMKYMEDSEVLVDHDNKTPLATWKTNKKGTRTFLLKEQK